MTKFTYTQKGDYWIPDLALQHPNITIGRYGRMRRDYLREHHPILHSDLVLSEELFPHLQEIDQTAQRRLEILIPQLKARRGISEELKAQDQLRWVREMNAIRHDAEEVILNELIYEEAQR